MLSENGQLEAHSQRCTIISGDAQQWGVTYIPPCVSVQDLHRKASDKYKADRDTDADIQCVMTLHLAFVPCNETNTVAG